jgi:hypothetical protein
VQGCTALLMSLALVLIRTGTAIAGQQQAAAAAIVQQRQQQQQQHTLLRAATGQEQQQQQQHRWGVVAIRTGTRIEGQAPLLVLLLVLLLVHLQRRLQTEGMAWSTLTSCCVAMALLMHLMRWTACSTLWILHCQACFTALSCGAVELRSKGGYVSHSPSPFLHVFQVLSFK